VSSGAGGAGGRRGAGRNARKEARLRLREAGAPRVPERLPAGVRARGRIARRATGGAAGVEGAARGRDARRRRTEALLHAPLPRSVAPEATRDDVGARAPAAVDADRRRADLLLQAGACIAGARVEADRGTDGGCAPSLAPLRESVAAPTLVARRQPASRPARRLAPDRARDAAGLLLRRQDVEAPLLVETACVLALEVSRAGRGRGGHGGEEHEPPGGTRQQRHRPDALHRTVRQRYRRAA